jgi:hypothetical protein
MIRALILVGLAAFVACTPPKRSDGPLPATDPTRLDHGKHAQVTCTKCHRGTQRPGADDHKPCDDSGCHKKEFGASPGPVCLVCHTEVKPVPLAVKDKEFPVKDPWQSLPPVFSHAKHLDSAVMENRVGFHVGCTDCHIRGDVLERPNHATCTRCHAAEVGLANAPTMEDCSGCHKGTSRLRKRNRLIKGDLVELKHAAHLRDAKGVAIKCEDCHKLSAKATGYTDHAAPRVESCVTCHDDQNRVRYEQRMRICETCHVDKTARITVLAPRNHLPATERPLDHTLAFRRDHAEVAARSASRCAGCHVQMSGNPKDACDECHQRMLPSDHRITFRELDHGPEAVADRRRCATCHVVEFCSACHSQRPRSHGLFGSFKTEHAQVARLNIRPCITCHERESFCSIEGCHTPGNVPTSRSPRRMR